MMTMRKGNSSALDGFSYSIMLSINSRHKVYLKGFFKNCILHLAILLTYLLSSEWLFTQSIDTS